jgi:hypothetical protein
VGLPLLNQRANPLPRQARFAGDASNRDSLLVRFAHEFAEALALLVQPPLSLARLLGLLPHAIKKPHRLNVPRMGDDS